MSLEPGLRLGAYEIGPLFGSGRYGRGPLRGIVDFQLSIGDLMATLQIGERLGPYEIQAAIGAGGMSARGHAEGISVSSRWGWGPSAIGRMLTPSPCRS